MNPHNVQFVPRNLEARTFQLCRGPPVRAIRNSMKAFCEYIRFQDNFSLLHTYTNEMWSNCNKFLAPSRGSDLHHLLNV